ncbi:MAG: hypothetical protein AB1424_05515 [Thermodesulfobacteriota bacterium]
MDNHILLLIFLRKNARKKNTPVHFTLTASSRDGLLQGHPAFFYAAVLFNASFSQEAYPCIVWVITPNPSARLGHGQFPVIDWV